jgi:hypothetical protein
MKSENGNHISMVQECTDSYDFSKRVDGSAEVRIVIPKRFADLWAAKLSDLRTSSKEIADYETSNKQ